MNTFKKKSLYARRRGCQRAGLPGPRGGVAQRGRPRASAAVPVLHGARAVCRQRRTTRCCRSSTRPRPRRPSRSASSKARTAAKSSTSTCTCRRRTSGSRPSSRPPLAPASSRRTTAARTARLAGRGQPDAVRQLRVHRRVRRPGRTTTSTAPARATSKSSRWARCEGYDDVRLVTHVAGVPRDCGYLRTSVPRRSGRREYYTRPVGRPVRLDDADQRRHRRWTSAYDAGRAGQLLDDRSSWFAPGDIKPNLTDADPISLVVDRRTGSVTARPTSRTGRPGNTVDAVSAVLMHDNIYNEFVLDKGTASGTDWVVTMPTKTLLLRSTTGAGRQAAEGHQAVPAQLQGDRRLRRRRARRSTTAKSAPSRRRSSFSPPPPDADATRSAGKRTSSRSTTQRARLDERRERRRPRSRTAGWRWPSRGHRRTADPVELAVHQLGGSTTTRVNLLNGSTIVAARRRTTACR